MKKDCKLTFFENFNDLNNWNFNIGSGLKNLWGGIMRKSFILKKMIIFI